MSWRTLQILLSMSTVALFSTTILFLGLWIRARERAIRATVDRKPLQERTGKDIEHLVNAVDAIAVEVERISEAQRFTTKVLVDRVESAAMKRINPAPERVVTPH